MTDTPTNADTAADDYADTPKSGRHNWWSRMRQKWWFRWGVDAAIVAAVIVVVSMWQGRNFVDSGTPAPGFSLADLDGQQHTLASYGGKKTMVVFWAPWCPICGAESDNISRVNDWLGERVDVISVVVGYRDRDAIDDFVDQQNVDYPVLIGTPQTAADYHISAYPSMYVIDADGRIEDSVAGYSSTVGMVWRILL